jgi:hypothetical protein
MKEPLGEGRPVHIGSNLQNLVLSEVIYGLKRPSQGG